MDRDTHVDAAMAANPATDDSEYVSREGGFFAGSKHFTVAGGTFTSIIKKYPTAPDFRRIPLGDIDLQHEIHLDNTFGVVDRQRRRTRNIRRVYSAKTAGRNVTVAMYQGNTAEEEWRQDIEKYMAVRHPNIVQLCGAATSGDVHATIFHDELIPLQDFLAPYRQSPLSVVYIEGYTHLEFKAAEDYFRSIFQRELVEQCTFCIRRSTGRFCVDLATIIDSMTLDQYHNMCYWDLACHRIRMPARALVNPGAVICRHSSNESDEFIRFPPCQMTTILLWVESPHTTISWLSQANYIFHRLGISRDFEDYGTSFTTGSAKRLSILCPPRDFQSGTTSLKWPDCSAYWSLHPSGAEPFSLEDAVNLGFPHHLCLRRTPPVPQGQRFRSRHSRCRPHLGHPLYQLLDEVHGTFSCFEDADSSSEDSDENTVYAEDEPEQKQTSAIKDHLIDTYWPNKEDISEHELSNMTTSAVIGHEFLASESTWGGQEPPRHGPRGELPAVSGAFKILRYIQLALISFLALSWLYDRM
ncbi:hypothetical protein B0H14DRAFT_2801743 [Mycena olivaceomarginata]|nr:hypothetical protein B0H14DRAFT_2801743 [Mycena olivaceomarginata]